MDQSHSANRRPIRPSRPLAENLTLLKTDDGSYTFFDTMKSESFHSEAGAAAEAHQVFLTNSGAEQRFHQKQKTRILEVGFGTGLNFWLTAASAKVHGAALSYTAIDNRWYGQFMLELNFPALESCRTMLDSFKNWISTSSRNTQTRHWYYKEPADIELHVFINDGRQALSELTRDRSNWFDIVYHDAFSPESSPELWDNGTFEHLFQLLNPGGVLATYCVKSEIQKRLKSIGHEVKKLRGPTNGKREVLTATKPTG